MRLMVALIVFFCLPLTDLNPKLYMAAMSATVCFVLLIETLLGLEKGGRLVEPLTRILGENEGRVVVIAANSKQHRHF